MSLYFLVLLIILSIEIPITINVWIFTANICKDNHENYLHATIADTKIERDHTYNSYIYNDINDRRQNPTLQLLSAIGNIKATDLSSN